MADLASAVANSITIGVGANHWTFSTNNVLTLFAGSQITDTLKITPSAAGFSVFAAGAMVGGGLPGGG
jgi:hypothetical protein